MEERMEEKWRKALTSILEELGDSQYEKFLEVLDNFPRRVKEKTSRDKMPGVIIEHYGLEKSISVVNAAVDEIPRKDEKVQKHLRLFTEWQKTQEEKENQEKKRKPNEVEEDSSARVRTNTSGEKRKRGEVEEEATSAADPLKSCQTLQEKSRLPRISIGELKSRNQLLETEVIFGKVIEKSGLRSFQNKNGDKRFFFDVGVADETACVKVRVFKKELYKDKQEGNSYMFRNVRKDQCGVKVIQSSTVSRTKPVEVPEELEMEAQELIYPESKLYSIDEAKKSPDKTKMSVEGAVEEIAPVKETTVHYQPQKKKIQRLKLKDETGTIWICMWGEETKQCRDLSLGDVVKITNVKTNDYFGEISLNSTVFTKIHKIKTLGVHKAKVEVIGIIKATKKETHLEAEFNQQVHTFVMGSPALTKALDIKLDNDLLGSLVDKLRFIADVEIKGNRIKKMKVVSEMQK